VNCLRYEVVLPAAGSGKRMGAGQNKLFLRLLDRPILVHTLQVFEQDENCTGIWLAVKDEERPFIQSLLDKYQISKVKGLPTGGAERQHSVHSCIKEMNAVDVVLVHDAARPFITLSTIAELSKIAYEKGAAIAGVRAKDTMKVVHNGLIKETVDRDSLWMVQTPQAFKFDLLVEAEDVAEKVGFLGTDEAMLVERLGHEIHMVESSYENVKMTTQEDLIFGEAILNRRNAIQ
jgi:2-C-methyl-D-erythritol 4-phosphate cytidylyltransferase